MLPLKIFRNLGQPTGSSQEHINDLIRSIYYMNSNLFQSYSEECKMWLESAKIFWQQYAPSLNVISYKFYIMKKYCLLQNRYVYYMAKTTNFDAKIQTCYWTISYLYIHIWYYHRHLISASNWTHKLCLLQHKSSHWRCACLHTQAGTVMHITPMQTDAHTFPCPHLQFWPIWTMKTDRWIINNKN